MNTAARLLIVLTGASALSGCVIDQPDFAEFGLACNEQHPCPGGFECVSGECLPNGAPPAEGEGEGPAEGEGEGPAEGEGDPREPVPPMCLKS